TQCRQKGQKFRARRSDSGTASGTGNRSRRHQVRRAMEEEIGTLKIHTKAVHTGDRKKLGSHIPVTTPIYTASAYSYDSMAQLDRIFGQEEEGPCYARYDNPSAAALEEVVCDLEGGHGALTCASGMAALHIAVMTALTDRRKSIVAANSMYGATTAMLMSVFEPSGISVRFTDVCDLDALRAAVTEARPGCVLIESISNPLLRVGDIG